MQVEEFIAKWRASGGSEMANFQSFANDLCAVIGVDPPKPAQSDGQTDDYRFERPVTETHSGDRRNRRIDLYRAGHFVMEAKQGAGPKAEQPDLLPDPAPVARTGHGRRGTRAFEDTLYRARNQADGYARAVSKEDGWPPFLLIVDVGALIEVHADFSRQGQGYTQFPDGNRYRIALEDLRDEKVRERLRIIWTDPYSLDPSLEAAKVTRDIAAHLAELGKSFEGQGHDGETVARFLMRCLFTMFAEDVELLPKNSFRDKLRELRGRPELAQPVLQSLWETMNTGGVSPVLLTQILRFNGGLFRDATALPLDAKQLDLLIEAANADWKQVEPAIFGTLLERALDRKSRHKLGAHYTPRAYVERLVMPTIIQPLRSDWRDVQAAADLLRSQGKDREARDTVRDFHRRLCEVTVLDPACGSGNFLYVALGLMKRLEGEVVATLEELGEAQASLGLAGHTVDPHQFLGIELNPWAANVAELVLWIGYLQWHYRTHGKAAPSEPILRDFRNIEHRDAILTWTERTPRMDKAGNPVTRWDGVTTLRHPTTNQEVPDSSARVQIYDYLEPQPATWPAATFIVGNPPFIGKGATLREALGDGYVEALWKAYPQVPPSSDLVMYWWEKAASASLDEERTQPLRRFGLISTNSLRQTFNRRTLDRYIDGAGHPLSLVFAIPDHPWVDTIDGAAVRISMTVAVKGKRNGELWIVRDEQRGPIESEGRSVGFKKSSGRITGGLTINIDIGSATRLRSNYGLVSNGVMLSGNGFLVSKNKALSLSPAGKIDARIRPFRSGRDLSQVSRNLYAIDMFGKDEAEVRRGYPEVYQHLLDHVKPERDQNNRESYKNTWWIFSEPRSDLRPKIETIHRFIATTRTAKHRIFQFLDQQTLTETEVVNIALSEAAFLSVLSSSAHRRWCAATGGTLEDRPRYNHGLCFSPFPLNKLPVGSAR